VVGGGGVWGVSLWGVGVGMTAEWTDGVVIGEADYLHRVEVAPSTCCATKNRPPSTCTTAWFALQSTHVVSATSTSGPTI
jgi:hypothetical protein